MKCLQAQDLITTVEDVVVGAVVGMVAVEEAITTVGELVEAEETVGATHMLDSLLVPMVGHLKSTHLITFPLRSGM